MTNRSDALAYLILAESDDNLGASCTPHAIDTMIQSLKEIDMEDPSWCLTNVPIFEIGCGVAQGIETTFDCSMRIDVKTAIECMEAIKPIIERRRKEVLGEEA